MNNRHEIRKWAAWLRANGHRQTRGALRRALPDGTVLVCAIGALEEVGSADVAPLFSRADEDRFMRCVVRLNDELCWSFAEIARWLELIADGVLDTGAALAVRRPRDLPSPRAEPVAAG